MDSKDLRSLVRFIRDTLGCGCPDEVFERIAVTPGAQVAGHLPVRIDVGGRLLIWVIAGDDFPKLPEVVAAGLGDRDRGAFNRFRLVLAPHDVGSVGSRAARALSHLELPDDRVHLHVVPVGDLPAMARHRSPQLDHRC